MIHYLTTRRMERPMREFLAGAGKVLADRVAIIHYDTLLGRQSLTLQRGAWIFTALGRDLGSLEPPSAARRTLARLHALLVETNGAPRVLNRPTEFFRRHALLCALKERGINGFASTRAADPAGPARYPVLLRPEHGTQWKPIPLLKSRDELERALAGAASPETLLAIEYCDTADADGVYRKYGAFVVGERIVPRHVFFSHKWQVKKAELVNPAQVAEEIAYLETNPHAAVLLEACRLARISYGRIDYALLDGRPQIWEINVTPAILSQPGTDLAEREPANRLFVRLFAEALEALDA